MQILKLIKGSSYADARGTLYYNNTFDTFVKMNVYNSKQ